MGADPDPACGGARRFLYRGRAAALFFGHEHAGAFAGSPRLFFVPGAKGAGLRERSDAAAFGRRFRRLGKRRRGQRGSERGVTR